MRFLIAFLLIFLVGCVGGGSKSLTLGTTTTTQDTGLLEVLLPAFAADTGRQSRAVVAGTGEVIQKAMRGDVDVLLTHSPNRERALLQHETALERRPVMYNRFLIVGTSSDPAGIQASTNATDAFQRIYANQSTFVSRGDQSGTHDKELAVWGMAGLNPSQFDVSWYKETGTGQGPTLLVAAESNAYMLIDEATLLQYHQLGRAQNLVLLHAGDPFLRNQYAVTLLNSASLSLTIQDNEARAFADWITAPPGQSVIGNYRLGGQTLFTPNANDLEA